MRISKFCASTWVCADRIALVTIFDSIGTSSGMLKRVRKVSTIAALNSRIRSSPSER